MNIVKHNTYLISTLDMALWSSMNGRQSTEQVAAGKTRKAGTEAVPKRPNVGSPRATSASIPCPKCGRSIESSELRSYQAMYDQRSVQMYHRIMHHRQTKQLEYCQEIATEAYIPPGMARSQLCSVFLLEAEMRQQLNQRSRIAGLRRMDESDSSDGGTDCGEEASQEMFELDL